MRKWLLAVVALCLASLWADAQSTGRFVVVSGNINLAIPDGTGTGSSAIHGVVSHSLQNASGAPAGAVVTLLKYRLRIHNDGSPTSIWHEDFIIRLESETTGTPGALTVYEMLGGKRDEGHDDDTDTDGNFASDRDIEIEWRSTGYFNGQNPNQEWSVVLADTWQGDRGFLQYVELDIHWRVPGAGTPDIHASPASLALDLEGNPEPVQIPQSLFSGEEDSAVDGLDTKSGGGEVLSDEVVVRFNSQTASRLHARMLDGGAKRPPGLPAFLAADDPQSGLNGPPAGILGVAGLQSGRARLMRAMANKPDMRGRVERGENLDARQRADLAAEAARVHRERGPVGLFRVKVKPDTPARTVIEQLRARPDVVYAEFAPACRPFATPNDPFFGDMWNLAAINMPAAWDAGANVAGDVRVCVIDTGVRLDHLELVGRIAAPKDVYPDDGDAYADSSPNNDDPHGHGTACAGIIAAIRDNNFLIPGIAPVTIIPVNASRIVDGSLSIVNYADGIYWGVDHGASVISCSFGGVRPGPTQAELDAMNYAQASNVVVVAAAGNSNTTCDNVYPAAMSYCISVGAVDEQKRRVNPANGASFGSNFGTTLDVCAPGVGIHTLDDDSSGACKTGFNGTSAATPHVAGLFAFLKHINPSLTAAQLRAIVEGTAVDQVGSGSEDTAGRDNFHGHGLIDAAAAAAIASTNMFTTAVLISNRGDDVLNVSGVTSSEPTWLTVAPATGVTLEPGESRALLAIINRETVPESGGSATISVTSDDADEATIMIPVSVGSGALPPLVESVTPAGGEALATTNDTVTLSVSATDPDGDPLTYAWFFNDASVPGEVSDSWAFLTSPQLFGQHEARIEISDGTFVVSNTWSVVVGNNEPGLAAYWSFDGGTGVDVSGRGHHLSITGRVETSASGILGEALRLRP